MKHQRMLGAMMQRGFRGKSGAVGSAKRFQARGIDKTLALRKREAIAARKRAAAAANRQAYRNPGFEQFDRFEEPREGGIGGLLGGLFGGNRDPESRPTYRPPAEPQDRGGGMLGGLARLGALGVVAGLAAGAVTHVLNSRGDAPAQATVAQAPAAPPAPTDYASPPAPPPYTPPPTPTAYAPPPPVAAAPPPAAALPRDPEDLARLLLGAMAAAAAADGTLDATERADIVAQVQQHGATAEDIAALEAILAAPPSIDDLVAQVGQDGELAAQVYAAALLGIDVDTPAERIWLQLLALRLGLPAETVAQLHRDSGVAEPTA